MYTFTHTHTSTQTYISTDTNIHTHNTHTHLHIYISLFLCCWTPSSLPLSLSLSVSLMNARAFSYHLPLLCVCAVDEPLLYGRMNYSNMQVIAFIHTLYRGLYRVVDIPVFCSRLGNSHKDLCLLPYKATQAHRSLLDEPLTLSLHVYSKSDSTHHAVKR